MKEIKVVIGKNFGDEGKGQTVSDLCKGQSALVVKHNGGAQAGHTVAEGQFRYVFHQLGSGSLWGAPTYLSHTFLPDLLKIGEEMEAVNKAFLYASPDCSCTVIYDVILNSLKEVLRGEARHGSCGMGIYEAAKRSGEEGYKLTLQDFADAWQQGKEGAIKIIASKLDKIRREYTIPILESLKEEYKEKWDNPEVMYWSDLVEEENLLQNAAEDMCLNFKQYFILTELSDLIPRYDRLVFENAQGLMLDEDNSEYYPHLTPSHTGLYNVVGLISDLLKREGESENALAGSVSMEQKGYDMEVIYVTRAYVTRHGAGRLDHECRREDISASIIDRTNLPNPWQSSLRFARHPSGEAFFQPMKRDLEEIEKMKEEWSITEKRSLENLLSVRATVRLNHLDETEGKVIFDYGNMDVDGFVELCRENGFQVWIPK